MFSLNWNEIQSSSVLDEHEGHDPNTRPRMELPGSVRD